MSTKTTRLLAAAGLTTTLLLATSAAQAEEPATRGSGVTATTTEPPKVSQAPTCTVEVEQVPIPVIVLVEKAPRPSAPPTTPGRAAEVSRPPSFDDIEKALGDGFAPEEVSVTLDDEAEASEAEIAELGVEIQKLDGFDSVALIVYGAENQDSPLGKLANAYQDLGEGDGPKVDSRPYTAGQGLVGAYQELVRSVPEDAGVGNEPNVQVARADDGGLNNSGRWQVTTDPPPTPGSTSSAGYSVEIMDMRSGKASSCIGGPVQLPATIGVTPPDGGAWKTAGWSLRILQDGEAVHLYPVELGSAAPGRGGDVGPTPTDKPRGNDSPVAVASSGSTSPFLLGVVGVVGLVVGAGVMLVLRQRQAGVAGGPAFVAGAVGGPLPGGGHGPGPMAPVGPVSYHPVPNPEPSLPVRPQPAPPGWTAAVHLDRSIRLTDLGLHRLLPRDTTRGRSWAYEAIGVVAAAGWTEKKPGRGEDAEPTLRVHESGSALIGAYDGTGGAGAAVVRRLRDGTELTGAYVSSRLVRDLTEAWAVRRLGQGPLGDPADLRTALRGALRDEASVAPDTSGVRGSLSKKLPTTAAVLAVTPLPSGGVRAEAVWAGDSRAFALTANHGLQVLTVDDSRETDALELIRNDQPMTNVIAADAAFTLHHRAIDRVGPALFLVATDGCFGYVSTPAHFEFHVLDTLLASADAGEWPARLVDRLGEIAADDVSFAVVAAGFEDFAALKAAFDARHRYLDQEHWSIFRAAGDDPAERERLRIASWEVYRPGYEALVTEPPAGA